MFLFPFWFVSRVATMEYCVMQTFIYTCWIIIINNHQIMNHYECIAYCKSSLNHLQLPYLRSTQKFDFFILFLTIWMDISTLICACGALTRTLSVCFDSMTGGMARIYILGRNAPENEPWPDVIGFSIIFIVSVMFMLGLEVNNTRSLLYICCKN